MNRAPVLGHIQCFTQCEIVGSQILLYGARPFDAGTSLWSPPVLWLADGVESLTVYAFV